MLNNIYKICKKFDGIIFLLFQIFLFLIAFNCESRELTIFFITYFYYSIFTGWHECVHRERFLDKKISFNTLLGSISITPLLFLSYQEKVISHLHHHSYTNDPNNDPDYNTNNLLFLKNKINKDFKNKRKVFKLNVLEILFLLVYFGKSVLDLFLGYILGSLLTHLIVNIFPHIKTNNKYGRDLGGNKLITFFLFSNNFHATHHRTPNIPWWSKNFLNR